MIEYLILLEGFLLMFLLAFVPGYFENRKPKDPGPLYIDQERLVDPRSDAIHLRATVERLLKEEGWVPVLPTDTPKWLEGKTVHEKALNENKGRIKVFRVKGDAAVPAEAETRSALIVLGDLTSGEECKFSQWISVEGKCQIGQANKLTAVSSVGDLTIGPSSHVSGSADSKTNVQIGEGCVVGGNVGSDGKISVEGSCDVKALSSRTINVISRSRN